MSWWTPDCSVVFSLISHLPFHFPQKEKQAASEQRPPPGENVCSSKARRVAALDRMCTLQCQGGAVNDRIMARYFRVVSLAFIIGWSVSIITANNDGLTFLSTAEAALHRETIISSTAVGTRILSNNIQRIHKSLHSFRGGGDVFTDEPEEAETAESTTTTTTTTALKRGTRTTGAGASKRRNPSIFASSSPSSGGQFNSYQQWTAAALSGDVLNRQHSTSSKSSKTKVKKNNPMSGRIWARKTDEGLIIKIPTAGDDESIPAQIMLSASPDAFNMAHGNEDDEISTPIIQAKHVVDRIDETSDNDEDVSSSSLSISSQFRPLEGIYGIYNLPCSGPHAVLITESEEVYTSPPTTRKESIASSETPLLQLRRIKSMEIVPLSRNRLETAAQNETISMPTNLQIAEEARQLKLLRNSFKDMIFTFQFQIKKASCMIYHIVCSAHL